jgi:hypothetical protein
MIKQICFKSIIYLAAAVSVAWGDTVVFQNDLSGYYEQYDVMMQSGYWGTAGYSATGYLTYGLGEMFFSQQSESVRSANLLKFNLEGLLPEGATVTSATLTLTLRTKPSPTPSSSIQLAAYRAKRSWAADDTYWMNWGRGGAAAGYCDYTSNDGIVTISATAAALSKHSISLSASMVQDWIDYPWKNYGILLRQVEYGTHQFYMFGREVQGTSLATLAPKLTIVYTAATGANTLTTGHKTLVRKGLQIAAMVFPNYYDSTSLFSMSRFQESNCTTLDLVDPYLQPAWIADDPNVCWMRHSTFYDIQSCEKPYIKNLISMGYGDEQDITSQTELDAIKTKFDSIKAKYPSVINMTNQGGGQFTADELSDYIAYCQPDMLMFDTYPFYGYYTVAGRPPHLYTHMGMYRLLGLAGLDATGAKPIPCALYTQVFTSDSYPWYGHVVSQSEMSLNVFAAWTYGFKYIDLFIYMNQVGTTSLQSLLFEGDGDTTPTDEFYEIAEINRQSRNLSPALVRLISTDIRFIPGQISSSTNNSVSDDAKSWSDANRPASTLFTGIDTITNMGTCNSGLRGDILVGFFKPLHESFDGPDYSGEVYFMVLNGLTDYTGSASATRQKMRLRFNSSVTQIQRLSRDTGLVETLPLIVDGTTKYYELTLDGGTADLFKIDTGAPFVGVYEDDTLAGDFNGDDVVNATDIDLLYKAIKAGNRDSIYDVNKDNSVNSLDVDYLIADILDTYYGDADLNGAVGVSDLSLLAAYYNTASGAGWANGDFDGDGAVGVADLSILAANYNSGSPSTVSWAEAYAQAFDTTSDDANETIDVSADDSEDTTSSVCSSLGLSLIAGLALMGLRFSCNGFEEVFKPNIPMIKKDKRQCP